MKNILTPLSIIAIAFLSCKNEEKQTPKVVVPFYQVTNQQQNQTVPNQGQSLYPEASAPNTANQAQATAPVQVAKGMNPPHGQPGHRCDIPVGAPLNSPITTKTASTPIVTQPGVTMVSSPTVPATPTPKGMNPPHGQAGHRCDIPVGSPLNTPVADKTETPPVTPNYSVTTPVTNETVAPAENTPDK